MLKKTTLAIIAAAFLASCAGGGGGKAGLSQEQIDAIKAATVAACSFVPTAISIAAALPQTSAYAVPASVIAKAICDAVTKQGAAAGGKEVTAEVDVDGKKTIISVTGYFVPKVEPK